MTSNQQFCTFDQPAAKSEQYAASMSFHFWDKCEPDKYIRWAERELKACCNGRLRCYGQQAAARAWEGGRAVMVDDIMMLALLNRDTYLHIFFFKKKDR